MSDLTTRVKLNVDVSEAQKNMRLIDQQYRELGKGADSGAMADGLQELIDSQKQFFGSFNSFITTMTSSTTKLASQMEATSKAVEKALKRDADKVYQDKLKELEAQKKMLEAQLNSQRGGGGTPPPSSGSNTAGAAGSPSGAGGPPSSPLNNPSNPNSVLGRLRTITSNLGKMTVAIAAIRAAAGYVGKGAERDRSIKQQGYDTFARTGYYGTDYSGSRTKAFETGSQYGYSASETMTIQGNLMARAGYTGMSDLTQDTRSLMRVSKAYGMDANQVGSVAGRFVQTGTVQSGEQSKFANLLATSIVEAGMTGRESEQLEVLQSINDTLGRTNVDVTNQGMVNALGLYNTLANQNSSLKGERGASMVSTLNDAMTSGGTDIDYLLGWGTKYHGISGRWQLEEAKARGISDPENLKEVVKNFESLYGYSIDSDAGKLMFKNVFGLNPDQVNELLANPDALRNGTYGEGLATALDEGTGAADVDKKIQDYMDSDVAKEEQFELNKDNAQDAAGSLWNKFINPAKNWFNGLSPGWQSALGLGGAVGGAGLGAFGLSKLVSGGLGKFAGLFGKGATASGEAATGTSAAAGTVGATATGSAGATSSLDDAVNGLNNALDGVDDALRGAANGIDDAAAHGLDDALKGLDDAMGGLDDALSGAAGGLDDAVGGASKFLGSASKFAKGLAIAGAVLEGVSTAVDVNENLQSGDNRNAASELGGGVGSIAGGAAGGAGGAALGGTIGGIIGAFFGGVGAVPGAAIGSFIGGLGGGVGGSIAGGAAGEAIGEGIYDLSTGGDTYNWTQQQVDQVKDYYEQTKKLYEEQGNNAAQKFTKNTVAPYLESIGVSKSVTKKYNYDVGKPDFLKDYENGEFPTSVSRGGGFGKGSTGGGGFGGTRENGSHATGNDYVPYDGYLARTHKGEAILTAHEAKQWREGKTPGFTGDMIPQPSIYQRIADTNADIMDRYARLIEDEADIVERRERLIDEQNNTANQNQSENGSVTSNNIDESKKSSLLEMLCDLFGIKPGKGILGNFFGGSGGSSGGYSGGGSSSPQYSIGGNGGTNGEGTALTAPTTITPNTSGGNTPAGQIGAEIVTGGSNPGQQTVPTGDSLAQWTSSMISQYEGNYGSINYNDNGAVSIGKIQWHGNNAKNLLNQIRDYDPASFEAIIQQTGASGLAASLASDDLWKTHTVEKGSSEAAAIKALLESEAGVAIQDQQRVAFVQNYIDKGKKLGLTDPKALAFYSDMCNQYGMYHDTINGTIVPTAVANGGSLDAIYQAAISNLSQYHERRGNVYNQLSGADLSAYQDPSVTPPPATPEAVPQPQDKAVGVDQVPYDGYLIRAHKNEALLTADEASEYREHGGSLDAFNSYSTPQNPATLAAMGSPSGDEPSSAQPFNGELRITLGGAVQGMTPENQNMIIQAVVQQIKAQGQGSILSSLGSALTRIPQ